jgi:DNA modification methylase
MKPYFETKLGKLYHGNCIDIMNSLDLSGYALLTDPMYGENQNLQREHENKICPERKVKGLTLKRKDWIPINDSATSDPDHLFKFNQAIIWGGNYMADKLPPSRFWIIWDKLHIPPDNHHDCEMAWTNLKGVSRVHRQLWRGICRSGEENISNGPKLHPFQKPIALFSFCIDQFKNSPSVFDPYAGSGTTGVICERIQREWICIEQIEEYCEVAAKRIEAEAAQLKLFA